jgi:hypothetical protein
MRATMKMERTRRIGGVARVDGLNLSTQPKRIENDREGNRH